jgi:transcriptional regulator with XRE-family HTH domain
VPASKLSKRFGVIIRDRRIAAALSQEQLAERSDVHPTYIGMVERGLRNPTLDVSERIANALGERLPDLLIESAKSRQPGSKKGRLPK